MADPVWATEQESAENFNSEVDAEWEQWWNAQPHAVRFPTDNDPED